MSPLIVGNHVMVGASGDSTTFRGSFVRWIPRPGPRNGSGMLLLLSELQRRHRWQRLADGHYDPELNLVYWGTGNPPPC